MTSVGCLAIVILRMVSSWSVLPTMRVFLERACNINAHFSRRAAYKVIQNSRLFLKGLCLYAIFKRLATVLTRMRIFLAAFIAKLRTLFL